MKNLMLTLAVIFAISFTACSSDDNNKKEQEVACVSCAAYEIQGLDVPAREVCEGDNGNAFVENVDTNIVYATYVSQLRINTTCE
jgi:hypothetical protein